MILLDTNALLFSLFEPTRIGKKAKNALTSGKQLFYSALSIAEIQLKSDPKVMKALRSNPRVFQSNGYTQLAFDDFAASHMGDFSFLKGTDPFDWMLLSHAKSQKLSFYTSDARLLGLGLTFVKDISD